MPMPRQLGLDSLEAATTLLLASWRGVPLRGCASEGSMTLSEAALRLRVSRTFA